ERQHVQLLRRHALGLQRRVRLGRADHRRGDLGGEDARPAAQLGPPSPGRRRRAARRRTPPERGGPLMALDPADIARTVQTREWRLRYYEAGSGHPVVLLHGSGPGATGWSNLAGNIEALAEHFHVYAVDMPGWGGSDPATVDRLDHVDAAVQFLDALGIDRAAFVGNSMGGQTSLRLATEHPDRISHLVTMGPPV